MGWSYGSTKAIITINFFLFLKFWMFFECQISRILYYHWKTQHIHHFNFQQFVYCRKLKFFNTLMKSTQKTSQKAPGLDLKQTHCLIYAKDLIFGGQLFKIVGLTTITTLRQWKISKLDIMRSQINSKR